MGNHSILEAKEHLLKLMMSVESFRESEHLHTLAHAIEVLAQCEHMELAVGTLRPPKSDFPNELDFD